VNGARYLEDGGTMAGNEAHAGEAHILSVLSNADIEIKGRIPWSSNATFLVAMRPSGSEGPGNQAASKPLVPGNAGKPNNQGRPNNQGKSGTRATPGTEVKKAGDNDEPTLAIYKPTKGERPLWDFPRGLWKREVAAYELGVFLGWDLVPPTAARSDGPLGAGSLQHCVDARFEEHYFTLLDEPQYHRALRRIAAFDLVANNADRKGGHCLVDRAGHIWAIDHGLCFHVEPKLRTVIWDFAGARIEDDLLDGLQPLSRGEVPGALVDLLDEEEIAALTARARAVRARARFPEPTTDFPYPWPLI
jgi:uncharacterized repeat protein (TIGR03843 family)